MLGKRAEIDSFSMNGDIWKVIFVNGRNPMLVDRTNKLTVATTDPSTRIVYLSKRLDGDFLMTVFIHELGHCALYSYNLLDEIHRMVLPEYWIDMEEFICNFLADFGYNIYKTAFRILGHDAWRLIPVEFEKRMIA